MSAGASLDGSQTIRQGDQRQVLYQWVLRAIGAELDARGASHITLLEGPEGFRVRFLGPDPQPQLAMLEFGCEELLTRKAQLVAQRSRQPFSPRGTHALPGGYQDFLRALGYELEQVPAYSILLDEQEEGFLLTYQCFTASKGYLLRQRMVVVDPAQREALLQRAYGRRQLQKKWHLGPFGA